MAKKRKGSDVADIQREVPNLFAILTRPGRALAGEPDENADAPVVWESGTRETPFAIPIPATGKEGAAPAPAQETCQCCDPGDSGSEGELVDSFEKIHADGLKCTACSLYKTRTHFVLGEGNPRATLVFIGEAPGADEDATGRPFVGKAGQHLDKILTAAGFQRNEVYICNILKDRPPENRIPTREEMLACTPLLQRQLSLLRPRLIALLGNTSIKYVVGPDTPGITQIHGKWFDSIFGIPCMPLYHPSYLLRFASREKGSPNWQMWQDIQELKKKYDEVLADDVSSQ